MDPLQLIRMGRMFAPRTPPQVNFSQPAIQIPQPQPMDDDQTFMASRLQQLFQPETLATDAYNQHVQSMPQYEQPTKMRRFAAAMAGFGAGIHNPMQGVQIAEGIRDAPFLRRMSDWEARGKALEPAMTAERYANVNNRTLATETVRGELNERRIRQADRKQDETERKNREDEKIRQDRAAVYRLKAENPDLAIVAPKGGNIQLVNKRTGQITPTSISTGTMTDEDRISLQIEGDIDTAKARGTEARLTADEKPAWQLVQLPDGTTYRVDVNSNRAEPINLPKGATRMPSGNDSNNGTDSNELLPTQKKVETFNKAQAALARLNKNGDPIGKLITLEPGNIVRMAKPGWNSGVKPEDYNAVYQEIFGSTAPTRTVAPDNSSGNTTPTPVAGSTTPGSSVSPNTAGDKTKMPPVTERKVGHVHKFPDGKIARWTGKVWERIQ